MTPLYPDVYVELVGMDGNAFSIIGRVQKALRKHGYGDAVEKFHEEATSGDYDHLLATVVKYVNVDCGDDVEDDD